ncbi:MAG TPA: hypothetical protein PKK71_03725, partial [Rectinema sp.]|nr:hypothetical protein [Rectinema sp.]HQK09165.1 hypothetical protein [Rectinema sp.]HRR38106.1 hypothetical protein [Rectinema sp.]HRT38802.1 hypothetical protein [Rectinema sp.]
HLSSLQERRYPALSALQNCDKNKIVAPKISALELNLKRYNQNFSAINLKRQKITAPQLKPATPKSKSSNNSQIILQLLSRALVWTLLPFQ